MNLTAAMICIAGLLNLPVPDRLPDVYHYDGRPYIDFAWGGTIYINSNTVKYRDHMAHELAHWVTYQAEVVHSIPREWDENKAQFVEAKFQTWCNQ